MTKQMHSLKKTVYCLITNLDSELIIQLIYLCLSLLNEKILKGFDEVLLTGMILTNLEKAFSEGYIAWFQSYQEFLVILASGFSQ